MGKLTCVAPEEGFLGLAAADSVTYESAKAVIIPFGLERSVSYQGGTRLGPQAMIQASHEVELFDEFFMRETYRDIGLVTLEEAPIANTQEQAINQLAALVEQVLADKKFPFTFGGEHTITAGCIRPFAARYENLVILHFDAHADLRDGYQGEKFSHAAAMRRCLDFPNIQLVSLGIRNISQSEIPFVEANQDRVHIFYAKDKAQWSKEKIAALLQDRPIYLSFDVDGFDASLMPATGTPEPGGLFWDEVLDIIQIASKAGNIVGADINELAPISGMHSCDFIAAKLAYKILSYAFMNPKLAQYHLSQDDVPEYANQEYHS
jgi:agmatinase